MKHVLIAGSTYWNVGDDFVRDGAINVVREAYAPEPVSFHFFPFNLSRVNTSPCREPNNTLNLLFPMRPRPDLVVVPGLAAGAELEDFHEWLLRYDLAGRTIFLASMLEHGYAAEWASKAPAKLVIEKSPLVVSRTAEHPKIFDAARKFVRLPCCALLSALYHIRLVDTGPTAFSLQKPHGKGVQNHTCEERVHDLGLAALETLRAEGNPVKIIAHHESEVVFWHERGEDCFFSPWHHDYYAEYSACSACVSTRLHSCLVSNSFGIRAGCLNDSARHRAALEGIPGTYMWSATPPEPVEVERILDHVDLTFDSYVQEIREAIPHLK